ncbi:MAG: site-specific DNA-methyltransferase [Opitutales bacterium]
MEKLKMHSPDFVEANIAKVAELFPSCVVEAKDEETGEISKKIDFDQLRQELSDHVVEGPQERYRLDWPGKREALLAANAPIAKTLRPAREESVDFDTTQNLFIEGDNLDALKLLQETYLGKVKMIYIDPPYNTGRDFIYDDDFAEDAVSYFKRSNQLDESGRLVANPDSKGRFHSDWLTMIYSRIRLAKNLLRDDGVLLVSIDDTEVSNLRKICDEVFGEEQFGAQIIWKKRNTPPNDRIIGAQHDYILTYVKSDFSGISLRSRKEDQLARYKNPDNHPKGSWVAGDLSANVKGGRYVASLNYAITNPRTGEEFFPPNNGNWRFSKERVDRLIANNEIYFGADDQGRPKLKRFLSDIKKGTTWTSLWDFAPFNTEGSLEMGQIFGHSTIFESPKPVGLLKLMLNAAAGTDGIVLDFFAGSCTTAHAVMQLNAEDKGNRRFIMIQLAEETDEKTEAHKTGYKTIAEIGKERIRRAGEKIKDEHSTTAADLDTGFRVLMVDTANMKDIYYEPDKIQQDELALQVDHVKEDRTDEDLLFQVMLDWGVDLALPIESEEIQGKTVYFVDENAIAACFAKSGIDEDFVKELAKRQPLRAVFRDNGFASDAMKINVHEIFKTLSPATEVKAL